MSVLWDVQVDAAARVRLSSLAPLSEAAAAGVAKVLSRCLFACVFVHTDLNNTVLYFLRLLHVLSATRGLL